MKIKSLALIALLLTRCVVNGQGKPETGADQLPLVLSKLNGKRVAMMVNQTSVVGKTHLVDSLKQLGINIVKIFAVEHGFRGTADAGEAISNSVDAKSGLSIISLYANNKKPKPEHLHDVDLVVFDIQDVGARFYTYISSLHYLMEGCAENKKPLLVLDRPNPNGSYVDGPILQKEFKSFVGMHPIPVVYGMTIGEYAQMINGQGWLAESIRCDLDIVKLRNWKHQDAYSLAIKPSPNLPTAQSVALYPSTCFIEGTVLSEGRGTMHPFEWIGHPKLTQYKFQFTPVSINGMSKEPKLKDQPCYGLDLSTVAVKKQVNISYLIELYNAFPEKDKFFNNFFDKLAGTAELKKQIIAGMTEEAIRATWQKDLNAFQELRKQYLLYP